ncbi:O-antigen ligase family protein [Flectobacillus longus]|uniref:O-antigen ligase family protein n=1 Tax=Flectobacillus longus TaxID=2984207 RepID=UPI0024B7618D|nr:O-antigen ligase family protein [Flectobacillus longus]MDI9877793.1 O-antigen ligase family protein [Flectobacillus longus]
MESKAFTKREGFISTSWLLCWTVFLLSWSVFISRTDLYDGKVFGQYFYFNRIAGLSLFVLGGFYIFYQKIKVVRISVASYILLSYIIYIIFHVWYKSTYVDVRLGSQLMCILLALMFSIERPKTIYILFSVWICGCIESIWAILQLYRHFYDWQHYDHPLGSLYNSGLLGIYLGILFVSALVSSKKNLTFHSHNQYHAFNTVRYLTLILTGILLPFTGSRTAWVGVMGGIITFLLQQSQFIHRFRKLPVVLKNFSIIIIGIIAYSVSLQLYYLKENSGFGRFLIWKVSLLNLKDNPIFGTGVNSFANNYFTYQAQYFSIDRSFKEQWVAGSVTYAFNDFLQLAVEYGIVGLLLFISIFIFILRGTKSTYLAVVVTSLLTGLSYYPLENIATQLHWFIFLGICLSEKEPTTILKVP